MAALEVLSLGRDLSFHVKPLLTMHNPLLLQPFAVPCQSPFTEVRLLGGGSGRSWALSYVTGDLGLGGQVVGTVPELGEAPSCLCFSAAEKQAQVPVAQGESVLPQRWAVKRRSFGARLWFIWPELAVGQWLDAAACTRLVSELIYLVLQPSTWSMTPW